MHSIFSEVDLSCASDDMVRVLSDRMQSMRPVTMGQFVGAVGSLSSEQAGLHGTAAALSVIFRDGGRNGDARIATGDLVSFVSTAFSRDEAGDHFNVIKWSEVLIALSYNRSNEPTREALRNSIADKITSAIMTDGLFGYGPKSHRSDPIPTCFAYMALCSVSALEQSRREFIEKDLLSRLDEGSCPTFVKALILYALSRETGLKGSSERLWRPFRQVWRDCLTTMSPPVEQNVAYFDGATQRARYVRVPWQLYLLVVAVRMTPGRPIRPVVASPRFRAAFLSVLQAARERRPLYDDGLGEISVRTLAVMHELVTTTIVTLPKFSFPALYSFVGSQASHLWKLAAVVILVLYFGSVWILFREAGHEFFRGLAVELFQGVLMVALAWGLGWRGAS